MCGADEEGLLGVRSITSGRTLGTGVAGAGAAEGTEPLSRGVMGAVSGTDCVKTPVGAG